MKPITAGLLSLPALPVLVWAITFNDVGSKWVPFAITAIVITPILWWAHPSQALQLPLIFTMAVAILYGPAPCVVTAACYAVGAGVVLLLRWKQPLLLMCWVAWLIYDALLYSLAYKLVGGWQGVILMGLVSLLVFLISMGGKCLKKSNWVFLFLVMGFLYLVSAEAAAFGARRLPYGPDFVVLLLIAPLAVMWCFVVSRSRFYARQPSAN